MKRKAQIDPTALIPIGIAIFILIILIPVFSQLFNSISCQQEKGSITDLQNRLNSCNQALLTEQQRAQEAINGLGNCQQDLGNCRNQLDNCTTNYQQLQQECSKKEQLKKEYYFIKVYEDRITLFESIVLYNIQIFGLFLAFGITFTVKFFEIDVEIKVLNKKNQKKLIKVIREYLIQHPYVPVLIVIAVILLSNLVILLVK